MAKIVDDRSAGKTRTKQSGTVRNALARQSPHTTSAPRGAISTKPHGRVRTFFREVRVEMSKVTWPPRKELLQATGVVIIAVIIAGVYIGVFDFIWNVILSTVGLG